MHEDTSQIYLPMSNGEMSESNAKTLLEIMFPKEEIKTQERFYYESTSRRKFFKVDYFIPGKGIVLEWDGPAHYTDIWRIKRDEIRDDFFENEGIKVIRLPYWLQMQKGVPDFIFSKTLTAEEELDIAGKIYGVSDIGKIQYSGLYKSRHTPANYIEKGRDRFKKELRYFPKIVLKSVQITLKAYISRVNDIECVLSTDLLEILEW